MVFISASSFLTFSILVSFSVIGWLAWRQERTSPRKFETFRHLWYPTKVSTWFIGERHNEQNLSKHIKTLYITCMVHMYPYVSICQYMSLFEWIVFRRPQGRMLDPKVPVAQFELSSASNAVPPATCNGVRAFDAIWMTLQRMQNINMRFYIINAHFIGLLMTVSNTIENDGNTF